MSALRRIRSGSFHESLALPLAAEGMAAEEQRERLLVRLVPMTELLPGLPAIAVDQQLAERLRNGYQPDAAALAGYHIPFLAAGDMVRFTQNETHLLAVARVLRASDEWASEGSAGPAVNLVRVFHD
jgi:tRNA pseudouridine55 synthase